MSLEELRAATPGVEWTTGRPLKFSGRPVEFKADGVRVADVPFSVEVYSGHHGGYGLVLAHTSAASSADQCESTARAVFTVIEAQTGQMEPPDGLLGGEEAEPIGARSTVMLSQTLRENDLKPILRAKLKKRDPYRRWLRANTPGSESVSGRQGLVDDEGPAATAASFAMDYQRNGTNEACRIRLTAKRTAAPPPPANLAFTALATAQVPSIGRRHFELSRLVASTPLPAGGVEMPVRCQVDRDNGRTRDCWALDATAATAATATNPNQTDDATAKAFRSTASRLARAYQFDMAKVAGLDRDDPQPVLVDIPVRLAATDIRTLRSTENAVPLTQSGFRWAVGAPPSVLERLYPKRALRMEEQTSVLLVCEVQEDFSPVCAPGNQNPRPAPDFEWAALEILTYYRAQPKTVGGQPTPGIKFLQNLQFKIQ